MAIVNSVPMVSAGETVTGPVSEPLSTLRIISILLWNIILPIQSINPPFQSINRHIADARKHGPSFYITCISSKTWKDCRSDDLHTGGAPGVSGGWCEGEDEELVVWLVYLRILPWLNFRPWASVPSHLKYWVTSCLHSSETGSSLRQLKYKSC